MLWEAGFITPVASGTLGRRGAVATQRTDEKQLRKFHLVLLG